MKTISLKFLWTAVRQFASLGMALSCMLLMALAAAAQTSEPTQQPDQQSPQPQSTQTPLVSRPIPERTIGLEPGKVVRWTVRDAIVAALENNVDIELERENTRLAQYDLLAAQGVYDPLTTSMINYNSVTAANTRLFSGTSAPATTSDTTTYNFGIEQMIEKSGGLFKINFNNRRNENNFGQLSPEYSPALSFQISQPIFKNFAVDQNRRQIRVSKKRLDLSDAIFRQKTIEIISRVQQAYWSLALAIQNEKIVRESVELAETQMRNNQRQVDVGTLAPIDVINAATLVETRRTQVFQTMNGVAQAENELKFLTADGPTADLWNAKIEPVESFDVQPVVLPLADAQRLAVENRPELKQLGLQKEINLIDIDFFRNQAKPQIDFIASYTMNGVGGAPRVSAADVAPNFIGGYGTSLSNLFKNDFRNWVVGVNFSLPLRNRTARANLGRAQVTEKQIESQTRRLLQNMEVEVRNAVQAVETAKLRIESSREARKYAKQQLDGEERRFAAGLSTTFFVLQRQTDLSQARFTELQALADYNRSIAELQRVISTTLSENSIDIKSELKPVK
ncbi:MAG: TolC family protein [Acidobacteria bacterium]|nr:TolC family protein [Acidobacteriota bacterium]MCI0664955.1 TolC family protein [Acidobacteriota bacterium]